MKTDNSQLSKHLTKI